MSSFSSMNCLCCFHLHLIIAFGKNGDWLRVFEVPVPIFSEHYYYRLCKNRHFGCSFSRTSYDSLHLPILQKTTPVSRQSNWESSSPCPKCKARMRVPALISSSAGASWFVLLPVARKFHDPLQLSAMQDVAPVTRQSSWNHRRLSEVQRADASACAGLIRGGGFVVHA